MSSQTQLALQSMSTEQTQMQYALDAFRRKYGDPSDDNVSVSWSDLHKNDILNEYLEFEKANRTMSMCDLRLRFLGKKMWHKFGSNDYNLMYKLLDHMEIIAGHSTLSQLFCTQITLVSKNVRRILINNPFKLRARLHLKPFHKNFNDTDLVISHMTSLQKLYDVTDLSINLEHISCKDDVSKFKKMIGDINSLTSITLGLPKAKRSDHHYDFRIAFFGGVSEMLKKINRLTIGTDGTHHNSVPEFRMFLLKAPLEFLDVPSAYVEKNPPYEQWMTSLKHVVVRDFDGDTPDLLLSAPKICKFECHLRICEPNRAPDRLERFLKFIENLEILEDVSVNINFFINKEWTIEDTKDLLIPANDKIIEHFCTYIQRAKNTKLRRLSVFDSLIFQKVKAFIPCDFRDWYQVMISSKRQEKLQSVFSNIEITTKLENLHVREYYTRGGPRA